MIASSSLINKDDNSTNTQHRTMVVAEQMGATTSDDTSAVELPNLQIQHQHQQNYQHNQQHHQEEWLLLLFNSVHQFLAEEQQQQLISQQQQKRGSSTAADETTANGHYHHDDEEFDDSNENNCHQWQQHRQLKMIENPLIFHDQISNGCWGEDPSKLMVNHFTPTTTTTQKKQMDKFDPLPLSNSLVEEKNLELVLSFTENEMELIENRFMTSLYTKQHISSNNSNAIQHHLSDTQSDDKQPMSLETNDASILNQTIQSFPTITNNNGLVTPHIPLSNHYANLSAEGSSLSNNISLPNKYRPVNKKKKRKPLLTTTIASHCTNTNTTTTSVKTQASPPLSNTLNHSSNTSLTSKKRERNNSIPSQHSPKKKTSTTSSTSTNSCATTVYRGHVSNSNLFSKESPWQFHTYSEGRRNQSENLVFFHFNPNKK